MFSRPHINPGVKRPCTRHCSIVDPSRGSVTPGFLIYQVTSRTARNTDLQFLLDSDRRPNRSFPPFFVSRVFTPTHPSRKSAIWKHFGSRSIRPAAASPHQTNRSGQRGGILLFSKIFQIDTGFFRLILHAVKFWPREASLKASEKEKNKNSDTSHR